jgi:hypothetical protein
MRRILCVGLTGALLSLLATPALAGGRYQHGG